MSGLSCPKITILFLSLIFSTVVSGEFMVGGLSNEKSPSNGDDDHLVKTIIPELSSTIKDVVADKLSANSGNYSLSTTQSMLQNAPIEVISYKTQVVAGINYFVKIKLANQLIFHVRIYQDFNGHAELTNVQGPFNLSDPIEYF